MKAVGEISRLVGRGWVRTTREYLDQDAEFDFRMPFPDSEGALWIRAVVTVGGEKPASGYRIALTNKTNGSGAVGSVKAVSGTLAGQQLPGSLIDDEWQHLKVHAEGDEVTVTLNGKLLATLKGQEYLVGYLGFEVSHGALDLRRIQLTALGDLTCRPDAALGVTHIGDSGVKAPTILKQARPRYSVEAMDEKAQGFVLVKAVVAPDGSVSGTCIEKGLHRDLDLEAVAAARAWTFHPATKDGVAIPVQIKIELSFTLRN